MNYFNLINFFIQLIIDATIIDDDVNDNPLLYHLEQHRTVNRILAFDVNSKNISETLKNLEKAYDENNSKILNKIKKHNNKIIDYERNGKQVILNNNI